MEFIAQSLQLVRGGSEPALQCRGLLDALAELADQQQLSVGDHDALSGAYEFLRLLENRLQAIRDRQTHELPQSPIDRARIAFAMQARDYAELLDRLAGVRGVVAAQFADTVFRTGPDDPEESVEDRFWIAAPDERLEALVGAGCEASQEMSDAIDAYREDLAARPLDDASRHRIDALMPLLIHDLATQRSPVDAFARLTAVIDSIARRSAYVSLLIENPGARQRFASLAGASEFLSGEIAAYPMLLDELLDHRYYDDASGPRALEDELDARLGRVERDDPEAVVEALARFKRVVQFRTAVADFSGILPVMKVADQLTAIAEMIVAAVLRTAWREAIGRYGVPRLKRDGTELDAGFAVVAYGKLAGLELGYGSDLDIVFLHDSSGTEARTDGEKPIDNDVFFTRLARRLMHFLGVMTTAGKLYEVDIRLRPSGRSGLLVSNLDAFERYQRTDAWTWEHQALLRSRAVAGDAGVRQEFERIRRETLIRYVRRDTLRDQVRKMRERMRAELSKAAGHQFDVKQDVGGIADIEFLVQYLVLVHAHECADLLEYPDNVRQLEQLERHGYCEPAVAEGLRAAYLDYRREINRLSLEHCPPLVGDERFRAERKLVRDAWDRYLEKT